MYETWFNREAQGMILTTNMISPASQAEPNDLDASPLLSRWSDVVFLEWSNQIAGSEAGLNDLEHPLHIIFDNIVNPDAKNLIDTVARKVKLPLPYQFAEWPGYSFFPDMEEFRALMGAVHGHTVGFFLAQHKQRFGVKTVIKITAFRSETVEYRRCLAFEIGDAGDSPSPPPSPSNVYNAAPGDQQLLR
jgi:hypothetical protein